jgi:hypothetical protein
LNVEVFFTLADVREKLERWRQNYNQVRPHSALGDHPPETFAAGLKDTATPRPEPSPDGPRKPAAGNSLEISLESVEPKNAGQIGLNRTTHAVSSTSTWHAFAGRVILATIASHSDTED